MMTVETVTLYKELVIYIVIAMSNYLVRSGYSFESCYHFNTSNFHESLYSVYTIVLHDLYAIIIRLDQYVVLCAFV